MESKNFVLYITLVSCLFFFGSKAIHHKKEPTIVYVDMVGDLFHAGHISFLQKAKNFGDYLVVGVLNDETCTSYKRKPILTQEERVKAIEACRFVHKVIPNAPLKITNEFINKHKITVVVHGDDYKKEITNYCYDAAIKRGIYKTVPYTKGISTTEFIDRIKSI